MSDTDNEQFENRYFTFRGMFKEKVMASLRKLFDSEKVEPLFSIVEQFSLKCSSEDKDYKKKIHDLIENFDWNEAKISKPMVLRHGKTVEIPITITMIEKIER